jgi:hypothetical protein
MGTRQQGNTTFLVIAAARWLTRLTDRHLDHHAGVTHGRRGRSN